uniref:hypothetical protein n=1 Tax=Anaplasma marginale TaxID=770 RepID=UPI0005B37092
KAANLAEKNKSETKKLLTPDSLTPESALLTSKNPWVEFYQQKIIPAIVSLESAFDLFPHNFVRNCYDRLDGDPGYRSSSGGQSFTVSWRDGQPVYRDWKEAESGDLVKYYWRSRGYSGYPRGKDYIEIVKEIAARHNISVPNELTRSIEEPDEREYQQYLKWEEEQEIVDRYLDEQKFIYWLNNEFITWLKAQKNKLSKKFKGFVTKDLENTAIAREKTCQKQ